MKRALITGGSRGIGRAICISLASRGIHVIINYNSSATAASALRDTILESGGSASVLPFDVTDRSTVTECLDTEVSRNGPIQILVNNAGVTRDEVFGFMAPEQWDEVIQTRLSGFYNVTRPLE